MSTHSSFWLDKDLFNDDVIVERDQLDINRIARLAAVRRAVANFVSILSGKNVPVEFSSGKQSYTDGEVVVISADDDTEKFDSMVGLALHEGSHVLLTDFMFLKQVMKLMPTDNYWGDATVWGEHPHKQFNITKQAGLSSILSEPLVAALGPIPVRDPNDHYGEKFWADPYWPRAKKMIGDLKDIMNILEDRRIDKYVYQNAQGYRPYYDALYSRYFFTSEVGKNLKFNPDWREITVENYINRLIFAFHPDNSHDAMPGLPYLMQMMDLATIERVAPEATPVYHTKVPTFTETPRLWQDACNLYATILTYTGLALPPEQKQESNAPGIPQDMLEQLLKDMPPGALPNLDGAPLQSKPVEKDTKGKGANKREVDGKFNPKKGEKEVVTAKTVMNGEAKKKQLKKAEKEAVDALETADAKMVDLKGDGVPFGKCMVLRKVTKQLLEQDWFIFGRAWRSQKVEDALASGRKMGAILHHRLQVRNDPMLTKQTRLPHGGLDRRLLSQLGMDITSVFHKSRTDIHRPVMLHLSLDASGSMSGSKWDKVVTVATAIAYLSKKLQNVEAVISIRGGNDMPLVAIVFDSRKDQFITFQNNMRNVAPAGATPEGLCFKATMDLITEHTDTHDVYFINFSDGEPSFSMKDSRTGNWTAYSGEHAANHTKTQIRTMREAGVKVLSYFITDSNYIGAGAKRLFTMMYGENAVFVNVQQANEVLRTLNKLLLNRGT